MLVRVEEITDFDAVRQVNRLAFGSDTEGRIVDRIRKNANPVLSLVADEDGIVGHLLLSPVSRSPEDPNLIMALGPMAVIPARQRQGIGSALVVAGLDACRRTGAGGVVVIGHPEFYPRFGFRPASEFRLTCEFEVPPNVFMAIEFKEHVLQGAMIRFHPAFSEE
jgi:putative acetyltransferase